MSGSFALFATAMKTFNAYQLSMLSIKDILQQGKQEITLLITISYTHPHHTLLCLMTIDTEKTFDRVSWQFLEASLHQIGLGDTCSENHGALEQSIS